MPCPSHLYLLNHFVRRRLLFLIKTNERSTARQRDERIAKSSVQQRDQPRRRQYTNVQYHVKYFSRIFSKAWTKYMNNPELADTIDLSSPTAQSVGNDWDIEEVNKRLKSSVSGYNTVKTGKVIRHVITAKPGDRHLRHGAAGLVAITLSNSSSHVEVQ